MRFLLSLLAFLYVISPWDILPDFFVGLGWTDDLLILFLLWLYFYRKKRYAYETSYYRTGQADQRETHEGRSERSETARVPKDPWGVLGVDRDSSPEDIKKAYRRLVNQYHPDKVAHLGEEFRELAEMRFKEIHGAYQELRSENKRADPKP